MHTTCYKHVYDLLTTCKKHATFKNVHSAEFGVLADWRAPGEVIKWNTTVEGSWGVWHRNPCGLLRPQLSISATEVRESRKEMEVHIRDHRQTTESISINMVIKSRLRKWSTYVYRLMSSWQHCNHTDLLAIDLMVAYQAKWSGKWRPLYCSSHSLDSIRLENSIPSLYQFYFHPSFNSIPLPVSIPFLLPVSIPSLLPVSIPPPASFNSIPCQFQFHPMPVSIPSLCQFECTKYRMTTMATSNTVDCGIRSFFVFYCMWTCPLVTLVTSKISNRFKNSYMKKLTCLFFGAAFIDMNPAF